MAHSRPPRVADGAGRHDGVGHAVDQAFVGRRDRRENAAEFDVVADDEVVRAERTRPSSVAIASLARS
jgi:hypothetical protein